MLVVVGQFMVFTKAYYEIMFILKYATYYIIEEDYDYEYKF